MNFGNILKDLRNKRGLTQLQLAKILDISKSNISKYEAGSVEPNIDTLTHIANYFDVPTDYLLGIGVFENWDILLKNKTIAIHHISKQAQILSVNIKDGMDDIAFAKLVYAFDVHINMHEDGTIGLSAKDPIPTYTSNYFSNVSAVNDTEKNLLSLYRTTTFEGKNEILDLLTSFCSLNKKNRTIVLGKCYDLENLQSSVAADESLKSAK